MPKTDPLVQFCTSLEKAGEKGSFVNCVTEIVAQPTKILQVPPGLPVIESWGIVDSNPYINALKHIVSESATDGITAIVPKEQKAYETLRIMREAYDRRHEFDDVVEGEPGTKLEEFINGLPTLEEAIATARTHDPYAWMAAKMLKSIKGVGDEADYPIRFFLSAIARLSPSEMTLEEAMARHVIGMSPAACRTQLAAGCKPSPATWKKVLPEIDYASLDPILFFKYVMIEMTGTNILRTLSSIENPSCTLLNYVLADFIQVYQLFDSLSGAKTLEKAVFTAARSLMLESTPAGKGSSRKSYAFILCLVEHYSSADANMIKKIDQASAHIQDKCYTDFGCSLGKAALGPFFAIGFPPSTIEMKYNARLEPMMSAEAFVDMI